MLIVIEEDSIVVDIGCPGVDMCIEGLGEAINHVTATVAITTTNPIPISNDDMIMYRAASLSRQNASTYPKTLGEPYRLSIKHLLDHYKLAITRTGYNLSEY